jgi:hypothetical protein
MTHKPEIGTISHGTCRPQDLLDAFSSALELYGAEGEHNSLIQEAQAVLLLDSLGYEVADTNSAAELISEISDALNEYAPDGCYFGAHEGDGSDFGFWPIND